MTTSKLSTQEVEHIAKLANLTLTEAEITKFQLQLSAILDYIDTLQKVDTANVEETSQVTGLSNIFHNDNEASTTCLSQKEALAQTKHREENYFQVPAVIKKK